MPVRPTFRYKESLAPDEIPDATTVSAGVMSAADKAKLDALAPLTPTGVTAGSYTNTNLTVDAAWQKVVRAYKYLEAIKKNERRRTARRVTKGRHRA